MAILITCETAGTSVPEMLFASEGVDEDGEKGLDGRTVDTCGGQVADQLASALHVPCLQNPYRHELIDVTRSLHHRQLFGAMTRKWSDGRKQQLIDIAYLPYRERVEAALERILQQFTFVVHLSVRTFDLRRGDQYCRTDVGLLYDPSRDGEMDLCLDWIDELYETFPNLRVRRNYPRRGTLDSLTKAMRGKFSPEHYVGIEVWINRAWAARKGSLRDDAIEHFIQALRLTIGISNSEAA